MHAKGRFFQPKLDALRIGTFAANEQIKGDNDDYDENKAAAELVRTSRLL